MLVGLLTYATSIFKLPPADWCSQVTSLTFVKSQYGGPPFGVTTCTPDISNGSVMEYRSDCEIDFTRTKAFDVGGPGETHGGA